MKTDTVVNNLNPDFSTPVTLDYHFEKAQLIRFEVYDQDAGKKKETQGKHSTKVSQLVGAKNQTYVHDLTLDEKSNNSRGKIIIRTDSVKESNKSVKMSVRCKGLKSKKHTMKLVASNHPYLVIKRCLDIDTAKNDNDSAVKVYTSDIMHDTLTPSWNIKEMKLENLCNSNLDLPLIFEVWSYQKSGNHRIYGRVRSTARELKDAIGDKFDIIKRQGMPFGTMTFDKFDLIVRPSMVDYLRSGWKISLSVAIDFTASNGELSDSYSLHYVDASNPLKMTAYELAILQVGNILEAYDDDKMFPVFGFGAKPRYMGIDQVLH
jgi:hypothetical protein